MQQNIQVSILSLIGKYLLYIVEKGREASVLPFCKLSVVKKTTTQKEIARKVIWSLKDFLEKSTAMVTNARRLALFNILLEQISSFKNAMVCMLY